ncbi:pyridoxamine 5'-phosphate oxidase family protein [Noviherbaspirillum suwonense]|jgi:general stress protein 26|uniref:General stress protein 26 n=1 Tax=Noviherbaspirillum suwonense TaxID=1224511 RepID=A0ABY1PUP7_9BURK|nr:pyridoxamine 5'-phosphate oxidase family protein [Noviherbaspirillum suwonense]SMP49018.1 General stress protein 26 [Noviherbaspirillum suwonense]
MSQEASTQLKDLKEKIKDVKFGMFTTLDPDGKLSSRPMTSQQLDDDGNLWFFTSDVTDFVRHLNEHPNVNVAFSDPDDSLYVSVAGHAELTRDRAKIDELWSPLVSAWFDGGKDDPHLALIKVDVSSAEYWDTHSSKMTQLYALAKSALTGKAPRDLGEHKKITL